MLKFTISEAVILRRCILHSSALARQSNYTPQPLHHQQKRNFTQDFWLSLSASRPVIFLQDTLIQLHDTTGMPWWSTIVLSTVLLRGFITFPLALYQNKIMAKVEKISTEEMPELVKELKLETAIAAKQQNWTEQYARFRYNRSLKYHWNELIAKHNCHPMKGSIVILFQVPLWIMQSCALRNNIYMLPDATAIKANIVCAEMSLGGFGWIPNLTEVDHSYILPITLGVINLAIVELQVMSRKIQTNSKLQKYGTYFFRGLSIILVPIAAFVPSGLSLYWVTSSLFGLLQNLTVLSPKVRRIAKIPKVNSEHEHPYKHLFEKVKEKLRV